jgi:hypothetical protein
LVLLLPPAGEEGASRLGDLACTDMGVVLGARPVRLALDVRDLMGGTVVVQLRP